MHNFNYQFRFCLSPRKVMENMVTLQQGLSSYSKPLFTLKNVTCEYCFAFLIDPSECVVRVT